MTELVRVAKHISPSALALISACVTSYGYSAAGGSTQDRQFRVLLFDCNKSQQAPSVLLLPKATVTFPKSAVILNEARIVLRRASSGDGLLVPQISAPAGPVHSQSEIQPGPAKTPGFDDEDFRSLGDSAQ
jgi:hypothetical protein